ncbi:MAG: IMPACT family protein [Spirochaetaceae bacterium]
MNEPLTSSESRSTIKGSRFVGLLHRIETEAEAKALIAKTRASHPGASHVAYAYAVGPEKSLLWGQSDDGEPHGTAGRPIMDQISGAGLSHCLVMVVRYFGGTKLGTGGLVRAYGDTAKETIAKASTRKLVERLGFTLEIAYEHADPSFRLIEELGGTVDQRTFGSAVRVTGTLPAAALREFSRMVGDLTSGRSYPEISESSSA